MRICFYRRRLTAAAAALLAHCAACASHVDLTALPLEQLLSMEVYSASKFLQKASEAPSNVTVITSADIRSYGWRTLGDVARSVRGMYVSYDRNYSYLGARGFLRPGDYNTRFLLQIDGNRINDGVYDQAPVGGEFPLELELIERIEFVPGPGSSIYGSNAFFGVINVITKKGSELEGARASVGAAQDGGARLHAAYGWNGADGSSALLAASRYRSSGRDLYYPEFDTPDQNHGVAHGLDYERGQRLFARLVRGPLALTLIHASRTKGIPTASFYQPFNDPRPNTVDIQHYADLAYDSVPAPGLQLTARLFWGSYDSQGDYINPEPAATVNHDGSTSRWWGTELKLVSTRIEGHKLVAGLETQHDLRLDQFTYDVAPYQLYLDDHRHGRRLGLYLQDELALRPEVLLNLGLRYDHNGAIAGVFSPRAALIVQAGPATTLKAIVGNAYRAPNTYERNYSFPGEGGQLPNPGLRKERIGTAELGLVQQLGDSERLTATVFRNQVTDLISQMVQPQDDMTRFENAHTARAIGAELEYERGWGGGAQLRASVSRIRLQQDSGAPPVNAPTVLAKLNLSAPLAGPLNAGVEAQYVGARHTLAGTTGGFWLANLNLFTVHPGRQLEAALGISNLFDRRYYDPGATEHLQDALAQDGRRLRLKVSYGF